MQMCKMKCLKAILTLAICSTAFLGDYIVFKSKYSESQVFRAITDGLVHGGIGFLSAILFFSYDMNLSSYACLGHVLLCTLMSSGIDIDHAIVARSFYLKDISNLKQRGFLHCTSFFIIISTSLILYSFIAKKLNIYLLTYMLIIAYTSHHIRDANRRGLWLYPFGHTPALPKYLYISLVTILPHIYAFLYKTTVPGLYKYTVVSYDKDIV